MFWGKGEVFGVKGAQMHKLPECMRSKKSSRGIAGQGRMVSAGLLFARSVGGGGQKREDQ